MSPLMLASLEGDLPLVDHLLERGADPNHINDDGHHVLWFACVNGDLTLVGKLIEAGANVNNRNVNGVTCAVYAASTGKLEVLKQLLAGGADPAICTDDGYNALWRRLIPRSAAAISRDWQSWSPNTATTSRCRRSSGCSDAAAYSEAWNPQSMAERIVKVAVASKQGRAVDEHFGHAKRFWIYAVTEERCELLEQREVEHYCHGNSSNKSAMARILETINDCEAVLVAKIGDGPTDKLAAIGVEAVSDYPWSPVEEALFAYVRDRELSGL